MTQQTSIATQVAFLLTLFGISAAPVAARSDEKPDTVRVFYFGNSLLLTALAVANSPLLIKNQVACQAGQDQTILG